LADDANDRTSLVSNFVVVWTGAVVSNSLLNEVNGVEVTGNRIVLFDSSTVVSSLSAAFNSAIGAVTSAGVSVIVGRCASVSENTVLCSADVRAAGESGIVSIGMVVVIRLRVLKCIKNETLGKEFDIY
jgi:hypothetical protein